MSEPQVLDPATKRRMIDIHPDAFDLYGRLTENPKLPTKVTAAFVTARETVFEIELNGRPHKLTVENPSRR